MPARVLEGLTGVKARRFWDTGIQPSDAAALAGRKVIEQSGVDASRIGILINTSVCRDYVEPSVACFVHSHLGLSESCLNYDLTNACLGFLDGMSVAGNLIDRGQIDYALIVDAESSRHVVERTVERLSQPSCDHQMIREQLATLTVGSGAAALLLARTSLAPDGHQLLATVSRADTRHHQLCRGQLDMGMTDTGKLLVHGVALAARTWKVAQEELRWSSESVDQFALHQVSELHTEEVARTLGFSLAKTLLIYPEFGNVGPASVPMVLSKTVEAERISRGDRVVLGGIGSGLNCTAAGVAW
jgi:3-oxoacyl-[acyl-carrier-protein] synthase-3